MKKHLFKSRALGLLATLIFVSGAALAAAPKSKSRAKPKSKSTKVITVTIPARSTSPARCDLKEVEIAKSYLLLRCNNINTHDGDRINSYTAALKDPATKHWVDMATTAKSEGKGLDVSFDLGVPKKSRQRKTKSKSGSTSTTIRSTPECNKSNCRVITGLIWK